jgi:hypothetical protein
MRSKLAGVGDGDKEELGGGKAGRRSLNSSKARCDQDRSRKQGGSRVVLESQKNRIDDTKSSRLTTGQTQSPSPISV